MFCQNVRAPRKRFVALTLVVYCILDITEKSRYQSSSAEKQWSILCLILVLEFLTVFQASVVFVVAFLTSENL